jgi:transmembrane 9 superfamily protein 2/4
LTFSFDFCQKDGGDTPVVENLGQVVFGERISTSSYELEFLTKETCKISCKKTYEGKNKEDMLKLDKLKKAIYLNYQHHWIVGQLCSRVNLGTMDITMDDFHVVVQRSVTISNPVSLLRWAVHFWVVLKA